MRYVYLLWAICLIALSGCGTVTGPSQETGTLAITPPLSSLKVGETQLFSAVLRSGASDRAVNIAWTSTDAAVVVVDDRGMVSARTRGAAAITARYAGQEATQMLAIVPDLAGRWTGQFLMKSCSQVEGPPPSPCRFLIGGSYPFVLTMTQTHADFTGKLTLGESGTLAGVAHGVVGSDGTLVIPDQDLLDSERQAAVKDWHSVVNLTSDVMDGTFSVRTGNASIFGAQVLIYGCAFHAAREH